MSRAEPLIIIGAGGFGRGVHDVVDAINAAGTKWRVIGYLDDDPDAASVVRAERRHTPLLGPTDELHRYAAEAHFVIGISKPSVRRSLDRAASDAGMRAATLVHPTVSIGYGTSIGDGSVLCAGVSIASNVELGRHVHVNLNCSLGHDAVVESYTSLFPQAALSGFSQVREGATLGSQSVVLPSVSVGSYAMVGAGAVVDKDVADGATVKGVPAR